MPFTLAHPAAIVPLVPALQRRLGERSVLSALMVGSMVPDIAFLLPIGVSRAQSHSLAGLVWCCLPIGLAGYLIFHWLLKAPLIELLPHSAYSRLHGYSRPAAAISWRLLPVILACIGVGALTHVAWDSFTHRDGIAVRALPFLRVYLFSGGGFRIYVYTALQWICSAMGLAVLAWWARRWIAATPRPESAPASPLSSGTRLAVAAYILCAAAAMALVAAWPHVLGKEHRLSSQELVNVTLLGWLSGLGMGIFAWSLWRRHWPDHGTP